jgi:hypothetical protein
MRRQPGGGAPGYVLDQRRVGDDETLANFAVAVGLVTSPQFPQLDRFDIGLQGVPLVSGPRVAARIGAS